MRRVSAMVMSLGLVAAIESRIARAEPRAEPPELAQEVVGVELTPVSFALGSAPDGRAPQRARLGLGGVLRVGHHRWESAYWTPLQAGLFLAGNDFKEVISAHLQTEGGGVFRLADGVLELGLAAGPGILAVTYAASGCDGSCNIGGTGLQLSPVVRYLFRTGAPYTLGAVIRAEIPAFRWSENCLGNCNGRAAIVLGGIEAAIGRTN